MATLQGSVDSVLLQTDLSLDLKGLLEACKPDTGLIHLCNPNNPMAYFARDRCRHCRDCLRNVHDALRN